MAVDLYTSNGGKVTCSPKLSCEGETPDLVILKDHAGQLVAEVALHTGKVRALQPLHSRQLPDPCMDARKYRMAVDLYTSNGGKVTCSPNLSCEGETPDLVILKDHAGRLVAEVALHTGKVRDLDLQPWMAWMAPSMAGAFCNVVAVLTLVGGLGSVLGSMNSYDPDPAGIAFGLGAAASSAPMFAIGSIANSTRRSAMNAGYMAELMAQQEERRRAAMPDA